MSPEVPGPVKDGMRTVLRTPALARSPLALYGAGLGGLLGRGLLRLQHTGRTTGRPRYAVLEVVDRPRPGVIRVVSGLGPTAQWFRNIQADPRVSVMNGWGPAIPATAHVLDEGETAATLDRYQAVHPMRWSALERTVRGQELDPAVPLARALPAVDLVLDHDRRGTAYPKLEER